jgi:hypothetical protein
MIDPGRHIRNHPIASAAVNRKCFIIYAAMHVPVRPNPALQCTPIVPIMVIWPQRLLNETKPILLINEGSLYLYVFHKY